MQRRKAGTSKLPRSSAVQCRRGHRWESGDVKRQVGVAQACLPSEADGMRGWRASRCKCVWLSAESFDADRLAPRAHFVIIAADGSSAALCAFPSREFAHLVRPLLSCRLASLLPPDRCHSFALDRDGSQKRRHSSLCRPRAFLSALTHFRWRCHHRTFCHGPQIIVVPASNAEVLRRCARIGALQVADERGSSRSIRTLLWWRYVNKPHDFSPLLLLTGVSERGQISSPHRPEILSN